MYVSPHLWGYPVIILCEVDHVSRGPADAETAAHLLPDFEALAYSRFKYQGKHSPICQRTTPNYLKTLLLHQRP